MSKTFSVEMPDGTIIEDVPEGTTQTELLRRLELTQEKESKLGSVGKAIAPAVESLPKPIRDAIGGVESGARMLWNVPAGLTAQGIGTLAGLATGKGLEKSVEQGFNAADTVSIKPFSESGATVDEMLGKGLHYVRDVVSDAATAGETYDPAAPQTSPRSNPKLEAANRAPFEAGFDVLMARLGIQGGAAGLRGVLRKESKVDPELAKKTEADLKARESQAQEQFTVDLDNTMIRYPQNYVAPQLGLGGKPSLPEGATRPTKRPDGEGTRYTQESLEADVARIVEERRLAQEAPIEPVSPFVEMPGGLEITQRGAPPAVFERPNVKVPDMPLESMLVQEHQPLRGPESMRGGAPNVPTKPITPDPLALPIDPLTRITAVEHLSSPVMRQAVERLERVEKRLEDLRTQFNDPVVQRGADFSESLGLNRLKHIETEMKLLEDTRFKALQTIEQHTRAAVETARKNPLKIERTHDGRQMVQLPKRMRGSIDADLLTLGIPTLIRKIGETATYKKFEGVFKKDALDETRALHNKETSKHRIMWLSPQDFHKLAHERTESQMSFAEAVREPIRPVVKSPASKGLNDLPFLVMSFDRIRPRDGAVVVKITGHEGRHRMDVFQELGLEQVPVRISLEGGKDNWGTILDAARTGKKMVVESETNLHEIPFPGFAKIEPETVQTTRMLEKQAGAADVELLTNIATLGVAGLLKKGLGTANKEPSTKAPKSAPKKPDSYTVIEAASGETRSLAEYKATLKPEEVTDITTDLANAGMANMANASFLSHFSKNPLVSYTLNRVNNIIRTNQLMGNMVKEGSVFGLKGVTSRYVDPNSPKALWEALTRKEKEQLAHIANEYGARYELSRPELKTLGVSEKVADAYQAFVKGHEKAIDDVNLVRTDKPINKLPGYFTKLREGDFKLSVIDKTTGDTVYSDLFKLKFNRDRAEAKLRERFGDQFEIKSDVVDRGTRGNPYNVSTVPFEELMQTIGRNDPRYKAIESVIRDTKGRRGFGRHAIHRRNIEGGNLTPENFYKAFEQYVDSAYRYKANIEMKKMAGEFQYDVDLKAPNLKTWVNTYVDLASGSFKPGWLVDGMYDLAATITKGLTLGQTGHGAPAKALQYLNNYFMLKALFAWRPAFLIAQAAQPFAFAPQWIAHYEAKGFKGHGMARSFYEGEKLLMDSVMGKAEPGFKAFISDYMVPRGNIDPSMIHHMDLFGAGKDSVRNTLRWVSGHAPAQMVESFGRLQTSAVAYAFFKKAGLKGKDLHIQAERFVNDVMVDYGRQEQPSWVGRTGIIGQAAGPLSTFFTNYASSTLLFMKDIADNPGKLASYKPMATHIAQTAIWAGLTGTLGAKVVDGLIEIMKALKILDPKTPTLTELVLTSGVNDYAAFGLASGMTGLNIGASMAAPDIHMPSANTFPGVKLLEEFVANTWPVVNPFGEKATVAQRQQMMKTFLPNYLASWMDAYEVIPAPNGFGMDIRKREPGEVVPNTRKRGFGATAPTAADQAARMLGTRSLDEIREMEGTRTAQNVKDLSNASKTQLVDLAADTVMYQTEQHDIGTLVAKAGELGMPPQEFIQAVQSAIKNRMLEAETRQTGMAPRSPAQQQQFEIIENFKPNFKKMGTITNRDKIQSDNADRAANVTMEMLYREAKKLFPNNLERQKEFVQAVQKKLNSNPAVTEQIGPRRPKEIMM